jgi:hypothetical protein
MTQLGFLFLILLFPSHCQQQPIFPGSGFDFVPGAHRWVFLFGSSYALMHLIGQLDTVLFCQTLGYFGQFLGDSNGFEPFRCSDPIPDGPFGD